MTHDVIRREASPESTNLHERSAASRPRSAVGSQPSVVTPRPSRPARITVINLHSSRNVGDAALLEMALATLREAFAGCHITLAMNDPDPIYADRDPAHVAVVPSLAAVMGAQDTRRGPVRQTAALAGLLALGLPAAAWHRLSGRVLPWPRGNIRDLLAAYAEADLIVGCPGNIFASTGRVGKTLVISALTVAYGLLLGKPFYVLPQSIGPFRGGWPRWVTAALYRRGRLVFAREPVSFRVGQELGLAAARLRLAPDLAFALPPVPRAEARSILNRLGLGDGPRLGVTVINRLLRTVDDQTWDRYEASVAHALARFMRAYGARVVFLPQVTGPTAREDDREAARRVVAAMGNPPGAVVMDDILPPAVLKALCGEMDAFVATRMHSAIFALSMGVPTLLVEYLAKTRGLAEMLRLEAWRLDLSEVGPDRLWEALDRLWQERAALRQQLAETIPPLAEAANNVGRMIAQDFYGR